MDRLTELPAFDAATIRKRSGGKLKDVVVLTARAHSMLSPTEKYELHYMALTPYGGRLFMRNQDRIASMSRVFDTEHGKSLPILNEFIDRVAHMSKVHTGVSLRSPELAVRELSSANSDHLQAADFAAGWSADLLVATDSDYRTLASKVRWAGVNGIVIPA